VLTYVQMDTMITQVLVSYATSHARLAQEEINQQTVFLVMKLESFSLLITLA
jgi:hypothetical protein